MKNFSVVLLCMMIFCFTVCGQEKSDSLFKSKNSMFVDKFQRKNLKQFVCKKAGAMLRDADMGKYISYTLLDNGIIRNLNGFSLYYSDSFFLVVEVRGIVRFDSKKKPKSWYFKKLCSRKVVSVEIPLHFLLTTPDDTRDVGTLRQIP